MLVTVIEYSGFRYAVKPRIFFTHGQPVIVKRVISTWLEEKLNATSSRKQVWRVKGDNEQVYTLVHHLEEDFWEIAKS